MKTDSVKNVVNLFTVNKKLGMDVGLQEIKKMTPQEGYLFVRQVRDAAQKWKEMRNNHAN